MRWTLKAELGAWQLEKKGNCTQVSAGNAGDTCLRGSGVSSWEGAVHTLLQGLAQGSSRP